MNVGICTEYMRQPFFPRAIPTYGVPYSMIVILTIFIITGKRLEKSLIVTHEVNHKEHFSHQRVRYLHSPSILGISNQEKMEYLLTK